MRRSPESSTTRAAIARRSTHYTGFPFANTWETFDNIGPVRGREDLMVGDVLVNTHSGTVLRHNLWYFLVGRNAGLLPYFFPGMLAAGAVPVLEAEAALAVARRSPRSRASSSCTSSSGRSRGTAEAGLSAAGTSCRSTRCFSCSFRRRPASAPRSSAFVVGALFTAQIVLNPFYVSLAPGEHTKSGALRLLPIELTLLHDLPVAQDRDRMRRHVGRPNPSPQTIAYFMDDNAFVPEEDPPQVE